MTAFVQCPNAEYGRDSQLGDDPLGRIFRCSRCLTKLPTAPPTGGDSRWTVSLRPFPDRLERSLQNSLRDRSGIDRPPVDALLLDRTASIFESGEFVVDAIHVGLHCYDDCETERKSVPDDSSEFFVGSFFEVEKSNCDTELPTRVLSHRPLAGVRHDTGTAMQCMAQTRTRIWGGFRS
jgi:hypothetical protein